MRWILTFRAVCGETNEKEDKKRKKAKGKLIVKGKIYYQEKYRYIPGKV